MKRGSNRGNNGYIGVNQMNNPTSGVIGPNKLYNVQLRELPEYSFTNTKDSFGVTLTSTYQRPVEWPVLPDVTAGSQQIVGLFAVFNNESNVCAVRAQGAYNVDWGDGTTGAFLTNTTATKRYDQTTYAGLTSSVVTSRGGLYKTALIRITPQSGQNLTVIDFVATPTGITGWPTTTSSQWLDIRMSAPNLTTVTVSKWYYNDIYNGMLEQFEFIGDAPLTGGFNFISCWNLRKILQFPSTRNYSGSYQSRIHSCGSLQDFPATLLDGIRNTTNTSYLFNVCSSLLSIPVSSLDTRNCTSMIGMFSGCFNLLRVPILFTENNTVFDLLFYDCAALEEIPYTVDTGKGTNFQYMFYNCRSLKNVPRGLSTGLGTNFQYMFANCWTLTNVPWFNTSRGSNFQGMFNATLLLKTIPQFDYSIASDLSFFGRYSIMQYVPDFVTGLSLTNTRYMFEYARQLLQAPLITNMLNVTDTSYMFSGCESIKVVPGITFGNPTTTTDTFSQYTAGGLFHMKSLASMQAKGISFNVHFRFAQLGPTALNEIYTNLHTVGVSGSNTRTIQVSGNWGYTASDRMIAISKGWAVT